MKRLLFLVPALLFVGVMGLFAVGLRRTPSLIPSALIDQPLPAFDLPALRPSGAGLASQRFKGEPKLLNVFASWCVSCRQEHGFLLALKRGGVPVEGLDWKDEPAAGARYLEEQGDPYADAGSDASGRTGIDLGVTGVPETFVVDRQGRIRYKIVGPIDGEIWTRTLGPLLDKLRREP